jgi:hypothetical protein
MDAVDFSSRAGMLSLLTSLREVEVGQMPSEAFSGN